MRVAFAILFSLISFAALAADRYAITMKDGSVQIMQVLQGTAEEAVAKWGEPDHSNVVSITKIDKADIPKDRAFRSAWTFAKQGKSFGVDIAKARSVRKQQLLEQRTAAIAQATAEYTEAEGLGDTARMAAAAKKRSDAEKPIPLTRIEAAKTTTELKSIKRN